MKPTNDIRTSIWTNRSVLVLRVMNSIEHYGLDITRSVFRSGISPFEYMKAFDMALFLSADDADVREAVAEGFPAGCVLPLSDSGNRGDGTAAEATHVHESGEELRVAFDFDGVIADDEAESVYKRNDNLDDFQEHERVHKGTPHSPGPLADLYRKLSLIRMLEDRKLAEDPTYKRILRIAIVTARNAPSHERVVTTLKDWGVSPDECFFLGGMEKPRVLSILKPHVFFDDQRTHLQSPAGNLPMVHVPFGVANKNATLQRSQAAVPPAETVQAEHLQHDSQ